MKISSLFKNPAPIFSFEVFPPRRDMPLEGLYSVFEELKQLSPAYISVTYGAGGSTQERTVEIAAHLKKTGIEPLVHLTCVGKSKTQIGELLDQLYDLGIENILALRGDPPKGVEKFEKPADGFGYASELVAFIKARHDFCVAVASYPDVHPEAKNAEHDLKMLKAKLDAGADFTNTQMFFDTKAYGAFVQRARAAGITQPIVPGVMPVMNAGFFKREWGVKFPQGFRETIEGLSEEQAREWGLANTITRSRDLLKAGAPGLHLYTMNKSETALAVHRGLKD